MDQRFAVLFSSGHVRSAASQANNEGSISFTRSIQIIVHSLMKRQRSLIAYLWVSPVSLLGLGLGLLAYGFGATMKRRFGVIEIAGNTRTHWLNKISSRYEAITLGHVILGRKHGVLKAYRSHEHVHVRQYERWGIFLPVMYLLASIWALVRGKHFYWDNVFEIEARTLAK
jgi:hypothetical protein